MEVAMHPRLWINSILLPFVLFANTFAPAQTSCVPIWDQGYGLSYVTNGTEQIRAMTSFNDGNGPGLFVGGLIGSAADVYANNICKWDGTRWSALSGGLSGAGDGVYAL